jgi:hypothetical protein
MLFLRWQGFYRIAHSLLFTQTSTLDPFLVTAVADHVKTLFFEHLPVTVSSFRGNAL